ncbi:MAG: hypothetical protein GY765_06700, partial [bacterium]|nr:hypothetical protein [bacterium]
TEVPCVIVNVMRGGPSTGLPTMPSQGDVMQARWGTHGDHPIIAIYPADLTEMYWQTVRAFNLAEKYRTPGILLSDELLGHMSERVEIPAAEELTKYSGIQFDPKVVDAFVSVDLDFWKEKRKHMDLNFSVGHHFLI